MKKTEQKKSRRQHILECLAQMLEEGPDTKITTASLAKAVGVSEAALYRHFPSKAKMFEGLIDFVEETLFSRVAVILKQESGTLARCQAMLTLFLGFAERNPGISRILTGDAIVGEHERLRARMTQLFERYETQLKQVLRESQLRENKQSLLPIAVAANLLTAIVEGRLNQFVRSNFKRKPLESWEEQWRYLSTGLLAEAEPAAA